MSQTQPELNDAINDLFGDSDDDDDLADEVTAPVSNTPKSSALDDDDLFESDEDDDLPSQPAAKRSRLMKSDDSQHGRKHSVGSSTSSSKMSARPVSSSSEVHLSGDEYDSDEDLERTADDAAFLDEEDDDHDLLREYENDTQDFHDDRPEYSRLQGRGGAGGMLPGASSAGKVASDPLSEAMADMKKKKVQELSELQKGELATEVLHRMDKAYNDDKILYMQELPAVNKLKLLPQMKRMLGVKQMQNTLLDYDLLSVLKSWVEPISKSALPNLTVRTAVYDLLLTLPCHTEHIKRSGIGKTLVGIVKCKMETAANKQKIREVIEKWSRPIFGKSVDARSMDIRDKQIYETQDEARRRREHARRHSTKAADVSDRAGIDSVLTGTALPQSGGDGFARVRCPQSNGFMFSARPASQRVAAVSREKKGADEKGVRGKLNKRLHDLKGSSVKSGFRLEKVSVSARDKA